MKESVKVQSVSVKLLSVILALAILPVSALELKGHLTQGGMIIGSLPDAKIVKFNDTQLEKTSSGNFVFGFGRDAQLTHTLSWQDSAGQWHNKELVITKREYDIDRITGVEKKYVTPPASVQSAPKKKRHECIQHETRFQIEPIFSIQCIAQQQDVYLAYMVANAILMVNRAALTLASILPIKQAHPYMLPWLVK